MQITRMIVPNYKWNLKCPFEMNTEYITIHNTANDASAMAEASYMIGNNTSTSFHVAVDDYRVVQAIEFNRNAFANGDGRNGTGNRKSISIEICYSKSGGERFRKAEILASKYVAILLKERNWNIDRVKTHKDWSGKYCPHRTFDLGWNRFLNMVQNELTVLKRQSLKLEDLYDENLYSNYQDLIKVNLFEHLKNFGINEGRIFSYIFDFNFYRNKYEDLKRVFGNDNKGLLEHFLTFGFWEGRQASLIYSSIDYINKNEDLKNAYGNNYIQALIHFKVFGINEGRISSNEFNVRKYFEKYEDLRNVFKEDWRAYYKHYLLFGINEGRKGI